MAVPFWLLYLVSLQTVLNAVARLVCCTRKYDHITHLLRDLPLPIRVYISYGENFC